jgi:hypothetical protein
LQWLPSLKLSGYDSHTEASENLSVGTDVDEGIDPRDELYLNESFCRVIFFHNKTSTTRVCGSGANYDRKGHRVKHAIELVLEGFELFTYS